MDLLSVYLNNNMVYITLSTSLTSIQTKTDNAFLSQKKVTVIHTSVSTTQIPEYKSNMNNQCIQLIKVMQLHICVLRNIFYLWRQLLKLGKIQQKTIVVNPAITQYVINHQSLLLKAKGHQSDQRPSTCECKHFPTFGEIISNNISLVFVVLFCVNRSK